MSEYVKCEECKYKKDCPVGWSYCNSACLTIQKKADEEEVDYAEDCIDFRNTNFKESEFHQVMN